MKPHIKLVRKRLWSCSGHDITRQGTSPKQAHNRWCYAVAALAAPTHVPNVKAHRPAKPKPVAKARDKAIVPGPIKNPVATGAAGAAMYSESMVHQVHGAYSRRPYVPPVSLRMNQARAAAYQPPVISLSSRAGDTR